MGEPFGLIRITKDFKLEDRSGKMMKHHYRLETDGKVYYIRSPKVKTKKRFAFKELKKEEEVRYKYSGKWFTTTRKSTKFFEDLVNAETPDDAIDYDYEPAGAENRWEKDTERLITLLKMAKQQYDQPKGCPLHYVDINSGEREIHDKDVLGYSMPECDKIRCCKGCKLVVCKCKALPMK